MRYSSALVLGTLAAGSAAAAHNGRHASFHARRQAESKRDAQDVDWSKVSYDLSGVNWSSVFNSQQATPTPSAAEVQAAKVSKATSAAAVVTPTPTAAPASSQAASSSKAAAPSQSSSAGSGGSFDYTKGVEDRLSALKFAYDSSYTNKASNIYVGSSSWQAKFINGGGDDIYVVCWEKTRGGTYGGMLLNTNAPALAAHIPSGEQLVVSFASGVGSACAPLTSSTTVANFGGVFQTWWEATFGPSGAFDVTREVNANGLSISSKGSKCTSDMDTCVFKCKDSSLASCGDAGSYDLFNCGASSGGGGGYDAAMGGTGGGCAMGASSETVSVTFG